MIATVDELLAFCKDNRIELVDLKFIDLFGRWHHLTLPAKRLTNRLFEDGEAFDGSAAPGYKKVAAGDMSMIPDVTTAEIDPFWDVPTLSLICDICEADTRAPFSRDPRGVARRAEAFLKQSGVAHASFWGPEFEFYIFDSVNVKEDINTAYYMIDSVEADWNSQMEGKNLGNKIPRQGGYHAIPPLDAMHNLRAEMALMLDRMGIPVRYHHHEVGGPGQSEIETMMDTLTRMGDNTMRAKYVIKNIAQRKGKTITFMPKPLFNEAGSGMHFHQLLVNEKGDNVFYDAKGYAGLSKLALYYIGGLLHHGRALLAFTNPSTNSYKRLIPGFEAPTRLFFGQANRSAAVRIPKYATRPEEKRMEFRPPDGTCNIYFAMAAQLLAGIDGIRKRIDPTEHGMGPYDADVRDIPPRELAKIKAVPASLMEACQALEEDHEFLLEGGVFTRDILDAWIDHKVNKEYFAVRNRPHPHEIRLYFDM
ncbi:MAG: type I glutamate--ammonia ligase [Myxococcales bacterium]|nr:MAG: type I glutamate--ammonia ligase [Myxococcales bacterium]